MTEKSSHNKGVLIFFCTRQNPHDFVGIKQTLLPEEWTEIEVPCSGRVGTGELLQAIAEGYERVAVLSCGEKSCIHKFGCKSAKKAMAVARNVAEVAGIEPSRLVFIEAEDVEKSIAQWRGENT